MSLEFAEQVTPGHPDKICDQISDKVLDLARTKDSAARCGIECFATAKGIYISGEIGTDVKIDIEAIKSAAGEVLQNIGYTKESGLDPDTFPIHVAINQQSKEIADAVVKEKSLTAGDQGIVVGYATSTTVSRLPLAVEVAQQGAKLLSSLQHKDSKGLFPDGKILVGTRYGKIENIILSSSHHPKVSLSKVRETLDYVVETLQGEYGYYFADKPAIILQPAGTWSKCGPLADTGLTGRKLAVDSYGAAVPHGGGAFSGKDASKIDRSGAYMARKAALWLINKGLAKEAQVTLAYAIGQAEPIKISVDQLSTSLAFSEIELEEILRKQFDFTPSGIIKNLNLEKFQYLPTACFGHFGHSSYPWEKC